MKLRNCIITSNGITCFYKNNINFLTAKYLDYYIGYITLRLAEILINDIISNKDNIKNIGSNYTLEFD